MAGEFVATDIPDWCHVEAGTGVDVINDGKPYLTWYRNNVPNNFSTYVLLYKSQSSLVGLTCPTGYPALEDKIFEIMIVNDAGATSYLWSETFTSMHANGANYLKFCIAPFDSNNNIGTYIYSPSYYVPTPTPTPT